MTLVGTIIIDAIKIIGFIGALVLIEDIASFLWLGWRVILHRRRQARRRRI